ncbi:MAG: DNA gyrase inhibitor YacG [Alphaproteobacteria bacterium]
MTDPIPLRGPRCPMCRKPARRPYLPFCSARCRTLDLGNWLGERYRIAAAVPEEAEQESDLAAADPDADEPDGRA